MKATKTKSEMDTSNINKKKKPADDSEAENGASDDKDAKPKKSDDSASEGSDKEDKSQSEDNDKSQVKKNSESQIKSKIDGKSDTKSVHKKQEPPKPPEKEEEDDDTHPSTENVMEGPLQVQFEKGGGSFGNDKTFYAKFFFEGQFLAFFQKQDAENLAVFYIKSRNIRAIEDFFNTNPTQVYVEYNDGKKDRRVVFVITDIKIKDKWVDSLTQYRDTFEDFLDKQDADYGKNEAEMKYLLTELFEREIIRHIAYKQAETLRF